MTTCAATRWALYRPQCIRKEREGMGKTARNEFLVMTNGLPCLRDCSCLKIMSWPHHWYEMCLKTHGVINILCRVRPGAEAAFDTQWDHAGYRRWWLRSSGGADGTALQRIPRRHLEYVSPVLRLLNYCEHTSAKFQRATTTKQETLVVKHSAHDLLIFVSHIHYQ